MNDDTTKSDDYWKEKLTPEQYHVVREKGTEVPGTGKFLNNESDGMYHCVACGNPLFNSDTKYESTIPGLIGWPSFSEATNNDALELIDDFSAGMSRTEVRCSNCGGHLGHLFEDSTSPNGKHFCINSLSLDFEEKKNV